MGEWENAKALVGGKRIKEALKMSMKKSLKEHFKTHFKAEFKKIMMGSFNLEAKRDLETETLPKTGKKTTKTKTTTKKKGP